MTTEFKATGASARPTRQARWPRSVSAAACAFFNRLVHGAAAETAADRAARTKARVEALIRRLP
ncbi:hypothetical protein M3A49_26690 [Paraburkholderia sp. CNPSo 3076]|uniref:hypothetical protein n=1 Tax=Paraburkholderia sp. CNPSo 3076 TaxID=2940936 RepID=UPI002251573C|nr:hypothetical protein [Paraburkholderia sp. CNPSo 3076]MCX5543033.1 hypothetical protein [Paraburkholderia sp. CNPSo 3076]